MKSFKQYITENWSHATPEDMSDENAHKYIFHTTSKRNAKKIVKQGSLEPRPGEDVAGVVNSMSILSSLFKKDFQLGDEDFDPFAAAKKQYSDKLDHTYTLRSGGDPEAMRSGLRSYGAMIGKGRAVVKFPIANLSRNVARRMRVDYEGSEVGFPSENPKAIKTKGSIDNKFIP